MVNYQERMKYFLGSMLLTIIFFRLILSIFPNINLNVGYYNVHHLFIGAILLIISLILLLFSFINNIVVILSGVSVGMILDELIYLIATDGSDVAYLSSISFFGMIIFVTTILIFTGGIYYAKNKLEKT